MENADEYNEYDELAPVRRCGYCGEPMIDQRKGSVYCTRRCKELAAAKRRRGRARVDVLREKYPDADLSLAELYERATSPRPLVPQGDEDVSDEAGLHYADEDQTDEDQADAGPGAWSDLWRLDNDIKRVRRRYEACLRPYLAQMRRNPGVRPPGLVELERQRDDEIDAMVRDHNRVADADRAQRSEQKRINEAHERQRERAALQALTQDLPGGSRRYAPTECTGRATGDIWRW